MKRLLVLTPLLLVACDKSPQIVAFNASAEDVAGKAHDRIKMEPGLWSARSEVISVDVPGIRGTQMADSISNAMKADKSANFTHCVTVQEADRPSAEMFANKEDGECRYNNFTMKNGHIDAVMSCTPSSGKMVMAMAGTYSATAYEMTMDMTMTNSQMPGGGMKVKAHTMGARQGRCPS